MMTCDVLIIGGGMAAASLVLALAKLANPPATCVISREADFGYNRVLLPELLSGDCDADSLFTNIHRYTTFDWLNVLRETDCTQLDLRKRVATTDESSIRYESVVFATGASPYVPNISGNNLPGVHTLRTIDDTYRLHDAAKTMQHCVVLGGGLLGLEAADALHRCGVNTTVVHRGPHLMNKQLDSDTGRLLADLIEGNGIGVMTNCSINEINSDGSADISSDVSSDDPKPQSVSHVVVNDNKIKADCVLLACGTVPRIKLAEASGINCHHGIKVDESLRAHDNLFAIGECARIAGRSYSYVEAVLEQASVVAKQLSGHRARFSPSPPATRLKVADISLFAAGDISIKADHEITLEAQSGELRRQLNFRGSQLVSAMLLGDLSGSIGIRDAIGRDMPSRTSREKLAFGF
ncbi:MAG: nitrite reductase (NADH) large subunit [Candidatus Azotimanducaceae bacterium]|jgi:nitrite reductase (NADH) large subunit